MGLDVPLVVMAGFDPMAQRNKKLEDKYDTDVINRDPLAYMAMTRATHGTIVVEPHAARFARHYRIRKVKGGGFVAEDTDGALGEMSVVVDNNGWTRLCPIKVDFKAQGLTEFPCKLCDPLRAGTLRELNLMHNHISTLPESIEYLVGLETLNLYNNHLTVLPESIVALTSLTTLKLHQNRLIKPQSLAVEAWLTALHRKGCDINGWSLPHDALDVPKRAREAVAEVVAEEAAIESEHDALDEQKRVKEAIAEEAAQLESNLTDSRAISAQERAWNHVLGERTW